MANLDLNVNALAIPAAGTYTTPPVSFDPNKVGDLTLYAFFDWTSGGTSVDAYIQTTIDGTHWIDIANFHFTGADASKVLSVSSAGDLSTNPTLTDGSLAADTTLSGLLGDQLRVKNVVVGTYVGTVLSITAETRTDAGGGGTKPGQATAAASMPVVGASDALKRAEQEYTRVADVNAYAAGDEISDNVTAGSATPGQLSTINLVSGGNILILAATISTDQKACVAQLRMHLYNAAPTMSGDNVAFGWLYADRAKWIDYIDFEAFGTEDGTNSTGAFARSGPIRIPALPAVSTLYYRLVTKTAFTPASGQKFDVSLFPVR